MNINRAIERLCVSLSLAVSAIACGQLAVRAETTNPIPDAPVLKMAVVPSTSHPVLPEAASFSRDAVTSQATTAVLAAALEAANAQVDTSATSIVPVPTALTVPVPGTAPTLAAALDDQASSLPVAEPQNAEQPLAPAVAQIPPIEPGRATRSGSSYVGVGVNIGAIGRTPLGDVSGAILSKIGLTRIISVRPAVLINGDATFLIPITLDFPIERAGKVSFAPYVGLGASFSTGDRKNADLIVSGGVDVPLSSQFTLTAGANAGLINGVELGVLVGVGYNFDGF